MSEPEPLLEVRRLARRHADGQRWLLRDASLTVGSGQRVALVGPSGAGKTLLLRAMVLLDPLDSGTVLWRGRPLHGDGIPEFRREAIYLQQRPSLQEESVQAALRQPFGLKVYRKNRFDRQRVFGLLRALGRDGEFLEKLSRDLSGGERQIAALVRALQLSPTLLLLDEPTAALDASTATAAEQLLCDWAQEDPHRAIVWVTHDLPQARRIAERTLTMQAGTILHGDA